MHKQKRVVKVNVHFSDYFGITPEIIEEYGAFNISLVNDLPLFIDPFLLFSSEKKEYQNLHDQIIEYVRFLRTVSQEGIAESLLKSWFLFPEVRQNWFGYSKVGNGGSGLGENFANALHHNLNTVFSNFGSEQITRGSHLEKLSLINKGVGKDNISDFTTNLIKKFLLEYTQNFTEQYVDAQLRKPFKVHHVEFDYKIRRWLPGEFILPTLENDYIILTPKDLLTRDEAWINYSDLIKDFEEITDSIPNDQLRGHINDYFLRGLSEKPKKKEVHDAIVRTIQNFPEIIDYFIKLKEDNGEAARRTSKNKVIETENQFIDLVTHLVSELLENSHFYETRWDTLEEACRRIMFLKQVIEHNDGYRLFYVQNKPIKRESDLQIIYRLTWFATVSDVNSEVNNGRGPVDYKISRGSNDATLIEFKLASNSQLKRNLEKQVEIYEKANNTKKSIKVILYFSAKEHKKILKIMEDLKLKQGKHLVLIDARTDNKPSASTA